MCVDGERKKRVTIVCLKFYYEILIVCKIDFPPVLCAVCFEMRRTAE
jgi:hypothetical protein